MNRQARVAVLVLVFLGSACGMNPEKNYRKMRAHLMGGNFDAALQQVEKNKKPYYGKKNRLLYYMDKGMVLHLAKRYKESNAVLKDAKSTAEDLWTESIGEHAASWLTTDNSMSYQGADFEKVALHFLSAFNYLGLGEYDSAQVEARQIHAKLDLYNSKYPPGTNAYKDDAFARYVAAKMFHTSDTFEDLQSARLEYTRSLKVYETEYAKRYGTPVPQIMLQDSLRAHHALGPDFKQEFDALRAKFPGVDFRTQEETRQLGEVVFIHANGEAPYKVDRFWTAQAGEEIIRIAYPEFIKKVPNIKGSRFGVAGGNKSNSQLFQNVTAIALQNLNDHIGRIKAKAIARSVAKYIAAKGLKNAGKNNSNSKAGAAMWLVGTAFNVGSAIAEEADKRSWITLPAQFRVARVFVEPGSHQLEAEFTNAQNIVVARQTFNVDVKPGQTKFVVHRTFQ